MDRFLKRLSSFANERGMPSLGDAETEIAFWRKHDRQMYSLRLSFLIMSLFVFPAFGLLDWHIGGASALPMLYVRAAAFFILLFVVIRFAAPTTTPDTRENLIKLGALATIGGELLLLLIAPEEAAQHYQFGLCVIMSIGAIIIVPRFRTTAMIFATMLAVYISTLAWHPGDLTMVIVNAILNIMVAGAVLVGSYERERLARLQAVTSNELTATNAQLQISRLDAVKARDEAIAASRSKNHFLANISHELRTPLNAILGFSDMIRSEMFGPVNEPRYVSYINYIHSSGTLLQSNINDLLDLARLESGKFGWEDESFDLCKMIRSAIATCQISASEAGVMLAYVPHTPDITICADRARLMQALINLITNAVKFSDPNELVEISMIVDCDGKCVIQVRDAGCGMSPENLERVRKPFAQAHEDSYSKGKGGLGLGLAIVSGIAERVDGRFELDSRENIGTVARLILPPNRVNCLNTKAA